MKLLYPFLLSIILTLSTADRRCRGVNFNGKYYDIEMIKEGINKIHQMALNRNDNTVYFTYDQLTDVPMRSLGYVKLDTREAGLIGGIRNASGVAIDHVRNKVYVGGMDGLYVLNKEGMPEKYPVYDSIEKLFFKDVLFFVNSKKEAHVFDNGILKPMIELQHEDVDDLIIDDDDNVFFLQNGTLFRVRLGTRAINIHERYKVNVLSVDPYYRAFIGTSEGVFVYNKYKFALDKVSNIRDLRSLTFNKNLEPVYAVVDVLIKLNVNPLKCVEF
ncbi:ommochrome-binding protein-like [Ostrinia nubilalis]|uniref:ommochrome-binding protein-like n=1 Tax=Ostrinia furnacalis TaxID=93504 RepID=UPI00103C27FD|nr:ommochrome-binding protein-like [Ostrinia furnacalis]XP_028161290.1 ommochrome-binding protein-like [Ostrinia furnacalis]